MRRKDPEAFLFGLSFLRFTTNHTSSPNLTIQAPRILGVAASRLILFHSFAGPQSTGASATLCLGGNKRAGPRCHAQTIVALAALMLLIHPAIFGKTGGSISGAVMDQSGAVVPGAKLRLFSVLQKTAFQATANGDGIYTFPDLPVGQYDLTVCADGFASSRHTGLSVNANSTLKVDVTLKIGKPAEVVTVSASAAKTQVDTTGASLGDVIGGKMMTSLPLNGRGYTDLLAIQPGISPESTLDSSSVIMAGVTGTIDPSGQQNPGNLSINGQRESANGFLVNGIDVQEHMNGGTSILPDLDSIEEFHVLTSNFDTEYGNYNGGIVTVISKSGTNALHGSAFEFLRNTALDARGYFDPTRSIFRQNQFGGTVGGPLVRKRLFFFADYQGTHTTQGIYGQYFCAHPGAAERKFQRSDRHCQWALSGVAPYAGARLHGNGGGALR